MWKLLVVDDETEICDFLKAFFEERNYLVQTAHNGQQAVDKVISFEPHVVLLDIQMPGMDGLEALKKIKTSRPQTRVLMVTAVETHEKIQQAIRHGADNYITKPLSLEYLEKDVQEKIDQLTQRFEQGTV
jgi:YesN/AraC family two-component response regulator